MPADATYGRANLVRIRGVQQTLLNSEGFLAPMLDRYASDDPRVGGAPSSFNVYFSIRGREQRLIDFYGGAQSVGGSARNRINGINDFNQTAVRELMTKLGGRFYEQPKRHWTRR